MSDKQAVPAMVKYQLSGELPPIDYSWLHILGVCRDALTADKDYVILPVMLEQDTKLNKVRLDGKGSPLGLVLKQDQYAMAKYAPYAAARFDAEALGKYAATKFNEMGGDALVDDITTFAESSINPGVE